MHYIVMNSWTGTVGCGNLTRVEHDPPRCEHREADLARARSFLEQRLGKCRVRDMNDEQLMETYERVFA